MEETLRAEDEVGFLVPSWYFHGGDSFVLYMPLESELLSVVLNTETQLSMTFKDIVEAEPDEYVARCFAYILYVDDVDIAEGWVWRAKVGLQGGGFAGDIYEYEGGCEEEYEEDDEEEVEE
jgi:hypothetical protein